MASPNAGTFDSDSDQLLSLEKLDRASPDLWPEASKLFPGVNDFAGLKSPVQGTASPPKWLADLENDDIDLLQEFGSLTTSQLMEKVRGLQNLAYQLGLEEGCRMTVLDQPSKAREMTRGKFLHILQRQKQRL